MRDQWLPLLAEAGDLDTPFVTDAARQNLGAMSAATVGRYLRPARDRMHLKGSLMTKASPLLRTSIKIRTVADERDSRPARSKRTRSRIAHAHPTDRAGDRITVDFDGIGPIDLPRKSFDHHRTSGGHTEVGIDHAYALTSYAVHVSTHDTSTSRVDATATRAETYVDITRGRHANHLYLTATTGPLDSEALPRLPAEPADDAVSRHLERSTGEVTAWELTHTAQQPGPTSFPARVRRAHPAGCPLAFRPELEVTVLLAQPRGRRQRWTR
jgi:hypothetical protein